ncbi:MAG TPA: GNAT family N-acetyltransferase [Longimicrobium sp.]|nr:GNAT family N-acetyltransferase [Longimicrobium sp.]
MDEKVIHNEAEGRYEFTTDGQTAVLAYTVEKGMLSLDHTVVPPELEGRGIGSKLAKFALDEARAGGKKILPRCSFIRTYLERHPEYAPLAGEL